MAIKNLILISSFLLVSITLAGQHLDGKTFIIQCNGAKAEGKVISVAANDLGKNGVKVQLWTKDGSPRQRWKFEALEKGTDKYYIINQSPQAGKSKYLDAAWTTLGQDGGKVQLWTFNGDSKNRYGENQVWRVIKNSDNTYNIISAHSKSNGKTLTVDSFTQQNNGGKIHLYFNEKKTDQNWTLIEHKKS